MGNEYLQNSNTKEMVNNTGEKSQNNSFMQVACSFLKRGVTDHTISQLSFADIFAKIVADEDVRFTTERFRNLLASGKTAEATECKKMQSCFATSVRFEGGIDMEHCTGFTNVVLSDYDHLSSDEVERCRQLLRTDPHCLMFYKSMGGHGNGFHILAPVMGVSNQQSHKIAWQQANEYFDQLLGLKHDTSCKDVTRKSFLAHDPEAFCNPAAIPIYIDYAALVNDRRPGRPLKNAHHTLDQVGAALHRYMKARNLDYVAGNRNNYIFNAACQLNRYGVDKDEALAYFEHEAYDLSTAEIRQAVHSAYNRNAHQHGTASPHGTDRDAAAKKSSATASIQDVEDYLKTLAEYRRNLVTQKYEIRWLDETEWIEMNDSTLNDIWRNVCKQLCKCRITDIKNIIESSFSTPYNQLVQSLETLKPWDGVTDHIGTIASMIHTKPGSEAYFPLKNAFKKWVVGVVASICNPQAFNKKIFALMGPQNTFKTSFLRLISLSAWGPEAVYIKSSFREFTKDEQLTMTQAPIFCLDEISHIGNSFLDELKSATSQTTINERRPYAHYKESRPRISSFCATGNYINFLTDTTGNNRFLVYEVERIDSPFTTVMNLEGMWSQAYQLYRNGYEYWFTHDEDMLIDKQNERYEVASAEEDLISTYYMKPQAGEQYKLVNATNIIERIGNQYRGNLNQRKINQVMRKLGFEYKRTSTQRGYMVQEIPPTDIHMRQQSSDWSHLPTHLPTHKGEATVAAANAEALF